jgi:hypothetical protein
VQGNRLIFVGGNKEAEAYRHENTAVIDIQGGTIIPGLVDSHTHIEGLGRNLERVNLTSAKNEEEAVALIAAHAANVRKGEWIIGWGWLSRHEIIVGTSSGSSDRDERTAQPRGVGKSSGFGESGHHRRDADTIRRRDRKEQSWKSNGFVHEQRH